MFSFQRYPIDGKTVFLRVDYNVPLENGKVNDNRRIIESLPTIEFLLAKKCKIVLATHLGRPEGKRASEFAVKPIAQELQKLLPQSQIIPLADCIGAEIRNKIQRGKPKDIFLLENLRFYKEEEENNPIFAHALASLAEVYVNDAFSNSHRQHASMDVITQFLPSIPGLLVEKEIQYLSKALHPQKPAVWILGGAKLDKVELIEQALQKADYLLIGGALAFPFIRAQGIQIGMSKCDPAAVELAKKILAGRDGRKIILPLDFVAADHFSAQAKTEIVRYNHLSSTQMGLDVGPETIKLFTTYLRKARTIVWNGPLGYYEWAKFATATKEIGRVLGHLTATSIVGGGETADALHKFRLEHNITHISTGGGASLAFLSGEELPALKALEANYIKWRKKI